MYYRDVIAVLEGVNDKRAQELAQRIKLNQRYPGSICIWHWNFAAKEQEHCRSCGRAMDPVFPNGYVS